MVLVIVATRLPNLRTDSPYKKEHSRTLQRLKQTLQTLNSMFYLQIKRIYYNWYGVVTYYVFLHKLHVIATYYLPSLPVHWSRLGGNCYGTKRIFTQVYAPIIFYFKGAIFITYLCTDQTNPPFQKFNAVI